MDLDFENFLEKPFDGYPLKDLNLPDDVDGVRYLLEGDDHLNFFDRLYEGYMNPNDETAFSDCYGIVYPVVFKNTIGKLGYYSSDDSWKKYERFDDWQERKEDQREELKEREEEKNRRFAEAGSFLYSYVKIIARALERGGVIYNDESAGYRTFTMSYDVNYKYDADNDEIKEESRDYTGSKSKERTLSFSASGAQNRLENEYKSFLGDKPIYRPYDALRSKEKALNSKYDYYTHVQERIPELQKHLTALKARRVLVSVFSAILITLLLAIPYFLVGSNLYVVLRKLFDFRYEAEWFMQDSAENPILRLLEFILKIPGMLAEFYMSFTCKPSNPSRIFWIVLLFIVLIAMAAVVLALTIGVLSIPVDTLEAIRKDAADSQLELSMLLKELPTAREEGPKVKRELDDFVASQEYREAKQTNQKLADAYKRFYGNIFDNWTVVRSEKAKR